nr:gamma-soluble NSF attachment protein isoform X1 [Ipomoea trifida]
MLIGGGELELRSKRFRSSGDRSEVAKMELRFWIGSKNGAEIWSERARDGTLRNVAKMEVRFWIGSKDGGGTQQRSTDEQLGDEGEKYDHNGVRAACGGTICAYLSAIIVYLYAHDFKEAEKCYNDCCQVETFLNSDQSRCASKFLSAYREGDEEEIKRVNQSSIVTNLDHTVLNALVSLFCRSNFSAETLWHGGWLLLQLLPHSDANFNSNHHELLDVISSRDLEPKLLDAAPDSGVLEMQLESHLAKSEGQDALQGDQQFTLAERMAKALAVMKCLDWNFLGGEW